jgi:hypothetical protein
MDQENTANKVERDPEAEALDRAVKKVSEDARTRPEDYLAETEVPEGGE